MLKENSSEADAQTEEENCMVAKIFLLKNIS